MIKTPLVSIITVTYNSEDYIERLLKSLLEVSYKNFEIIAWDNTSTDKTRAILNNYKDKVKVYLSKINYGYAEGNNQALKKAKGDYIFLINPDTTVKPNFLDALIIKAESDEKISAVQPLVYLMKNKKQINLTGKKTQFLGFDWIRDYKREKVRKAGEISSFSGSGVLIKREVVKKTGFFDKTYFMYQEDTDLSWRMRLLGYKIFFEPQSVIYHDYKYIPKESYHPLKNKLKYYERNRLSTIFKNYSTKTLLLILPAIFLIEIAMIFFSAGNGWLWQKLEGYIYNLRNIKHLVKQRNFIQKKRKVSDKEIVKDFKAMLKFEKFEIFPIRFVINPFLRIYWHFVNFLIKVQ